MGNKTRILAATPSNMHQSNKQNHRRPSFSKSDYLRRNSPIIGAWVFALLLPVFLILFNTSYITNSEWLYEYNWWRNDIPNRTGLDKEQLNSGAAQIKQYFNDDAELLDLRVDYDGAKVSLYNEREVLHMVDVKKLMQAVFITSRVSGACLLALLAFGVLALKQELLPLVLKTLKWSVLGTGIFLTIFGITAVIDFGWLFTQFHFLSFTNDLWMLDPRKDYLIIMFPQRFFFEATLFIGTLTTINFALLVAATRLANRKLK